MALFDRLEAEHRNAVRPLAARMRPRTLSEFVGQHHILAPGKLLRRMLEADRISSVVFYGPPGTGKTSLAELIAKHTKRTFRSLNAAAAGVKELRDVLDKARADVSTGGNRTVLFIDELHHFNKQQQNVLLPDVEDGIVSLVAATTANPFFAFISPLLSRSQIFELQPLSTEDVVYLLEAALKDAVRGLGAKKVTATPEALQFLATVCDGDARRALTALEIGVLSLDPKTAEFDLAAAEESIQKKQIRYDADGDDHYDAASAMIKSIRGSDPDAAIYWMARMLAAGEEPRFVARRLVISAAEDIGNADPHGLVLAQSAAAATEFIGMPECRIILAQAVTYLALAQKSNAAYKAIDAAMEDVTNSRLLPVPVHLRDAHYQGAARLEHGKGYEYPHDAPEGWIAQDYLGVDRSYYEPVERGAETEMKRRLDQLRQMRRTAPDSQPE
ncbi:replication-associated recombination protein A [Schlesneria sp. DSM 10557]|uniref:replication-associated recombination protein A n=1 Tax=Schlesneria sp. DSM 10557 TaxID=3044399 RepID=UPI00359F69F5